MSKEQQQGRSEGDDADARTGDSPESRDFAGAELAESTEEQGRARREAALSADHRSIGSHDQLSGEDPNRQDEDRGVPRGDHAPRRDRED